MAEKTALLITKQEKDVSVIRFTQNKILDEANIADIGERLDKEIEQGENPKLLLDFSQVDHLSSAALGMLININNKLKKRNGQLRLANIKPPIFEVFVITKLNKMLKIHASVDEAMASFTQH